MLVRYHLLRLGTIDGGLLFFPSFTLNTAVDPRTVSGTELALCISICGPRWIVFALGLMGRAKRILQEDTTTFA